MLRTLLLTFVLFGCFACSANSNDPHSPSDIPTTQKTTVNAAGNTDSAISEAGNKILKTGNYMAMTSKEIIRGSCWNYINTIYTRSGYPQGKRHYILKGKKNNGPYAKPNMIKAGDWLYYINHRYNDIEHSGIFVKWVNKEKRIASILSYGGESRKKPGRYRNYDLSHVYTIIRAKD